MIFCIYNDIPLLAAVLVAIFLIDFDNFLVPEIKVNTE